MIPSLPGDTNIIEAEVQLATAKLHLSQVINEAQAGCKHERIAESALPDSNGYYRRVCLHCGFMVKNAYGTFGVLGDRETLVYKLTLEAVNKLVRVV